MRVVMFHIIVVLLALPSVLVAGFKAVHGSEQSNIPSSAQRPPKEGGTKAKQLMRSETDATSASVASSDASLLHMMGAVQDYDQPSSLMQHAARAKGVTSDSYIETKSLKALQDAPKSKIAKTRHARKVHPRRWLSAADLKWVKEKYPDVAGAKVKFESQMVGTDRKQNYTFTKQFKSRSKNIRVYLAEGDDGSKVVAKFLTVDDQAKGQEEIRKLRKATKRLQAISVPVIPMLVSDRIVVDGRALPCLLMTNAPGSALFEMDEADLQTAQTELDPAKKVLALLQFTENLEKEVAAKRHLLNDPALPKELGRIVETLAANGIWMSDWTKTNIVYDPTLHRAIRIDLEDIAFFGEKDCNVTLKLARAIWARQTRLCQPILLGPSQPSGAAAMEESHDTSPYCAYYEEVRKGAPPLSDCSKETLQRHMVYQMTWHRAQQAALRSFAERQFEEVFGWMGMRAKEGSELPPALARLSEKYRSEADRRKAVEGLVMGLELSANITVPALD